MPRFHYTAIAAATGREHRGEIEAPDADQAAGMLKGQGLFATAITADTPTPAPARAAGVKSKPAAPAAGPATKPRPRAQPSSRSLRGSIGRSFNAQGLAIFTRQLATLVHAGMPILRSLEVLARQERNVPFRGVIESLADTIRSGGNFSDGLARHPRVFDRLYINMVKAGEAGGVLDVVLERLAVFLEKAERIKGKVKAAMTYPLIIMLVAVGIVGALMVFVIPKFQDIFASMLRGQSLPALTQAVLAVAGFVQHQFLLTLGLVVAVYALAVAFRRTGPGARAYAWLAIHLPVLGDLVLKAAIARFCRTLGTLLSSGVPILPAVLITRDTSGNLYVAEALQRVHDRVKEGEGVARPLEATGVFPGMVTSMIEVGEETGALPEMLTRIADTYDEEVDNAVAALTSVLEPIMIVFMAVVVGTIVIALFLPIIRIIQTLS
jgi:type IV pilus assembly protein PilC